MYIILKNVKISNFVFSFFSEGASEARHSRENSKSSQHSRQSSRDKGNHSRQNSRELLANVATTMVDKPVAKTIEIYATLPKKKTLRGKATAVNVIEDEEYMLYDRPTQRTGLFSRTKRCEDDKKDKKRARSEERNKNVSKDFSIAPSRTSPSPKGAKMEKPKETIEANTIQNVRSTQFNNTVAVEQKQGKKQHKIRRKLLMGGLIKRKNRSMPDLREGQNGQANVSVEGSSNTLPKQSVDDSSVGLKGTDVNQSLSGYLSEGHLEFTGNGGSGNTSNPNLERSRLMRKSFHGSAGKVLHVAKVPPPPPLRTTSQLSKSKCSGEVHNEQSQSDKVMYPLSDGRCASNPSQDQANVYWNHMNAGNATNVVNRNSSYVDYSSESHSLPFLPSYSEASTTISGTCQTSYSSKPRIQDDVVQYANGILYEPTFVVTRADVHNEQTPTKQQPQPDSLPPYPENGNISHSRQPSEDFPPPPYPSIHSVSHSRQASEDFPPPPPPIDEPIHLQDTQQHQISVQPQQRTQQFEPQQIGSLLTQLQSKREQISAEESNEEKRSEEREDDEKSSSETWLRELQAKQAERKMKRQGSLDQEIPKIRPTIPGPTIARRTSDLMMNSLGQGYDQGRDVPDCPRVVSSVKDMAARFEQIKLQPAPKLEADVKPQTKQNANCISPIMMSDTSQETKSSIEDAKSAKLSSENVTAFTKTETVNCQSVLNSSFDSSSSQNSFIAMVPPNNCSVQQSDLNAAILSMSLTLPHESGLPIDCPEDDISEVAMQNTIQNTTILPSEEDIAPRKVKRRIGKKKSVSFCDQVVLVATAEDDEKDSYIPNPILERVLRSAMNKPETVQVLREIKSLQEAEANRENIATKFQQQTLPLKSEADSIPATPFQDQLRSVNPMPAIADTIKPTFGRQNSSDSTGGSLTDKRSCGSCGNEGKDVVDCKEPYTGMPVNAPKSSASYPSQLQQQIRYTQNGYTQYMQSMYPQTQTSYTRNQVVPLSQTQKPASPYPTQMHGQFIQNGIQQAKILPQKNGYGTYYQLEQQHNQMNKQAIIQAQQNTLNQRIPSHNASPITVQHSQQQFPYPPNQSPSPYQNQFSQTSYQSHSYQTIVPQSRMGQPLPQYQPPPNAPTSYQHQHQQQQQQPAQNYQQRQDNYQRQIQTQKIDQQNSQSVPNQAYSKTLQNGQIQPNMKYPPYQHPPLSKQMHFAMSTAKIVPMVTQPIVTQSSLQTPTNIAASARVTPCNLCRKRNVREPTLYCTDCDFYMSRFRAGNKTA